MNKIKWELNCWALLNGHMKINLMSQLLLWLIFHFASFIWLYVWYKAYLFESFLIILSELINSCLDTFAPEGCKIQNFFALKTCKGSLFEESKRKSCKNNIKIHKICQKLENKFFSSKTSCSHLIVLLKPSKQNSLNLQWSR